jgi:hypothetical protein
MKQRRIYRSENGDTWWLCRADGRVFIIHEANIPSGGRITEIEIGEFLGNGKMGPEHQALLHVIGKLTELEA